MGVAYCNTLEISVISVRVFDVPSYSFHNRDFNKMMDYFLCVLPVDVTIELQSKFKLQVPYLYQPRWLSYLKLIFTLSPNGFMCLLENFLLFFALLTFICVTIEHMYQIRGVAASGIVCPFWDDSWTPSSRFSHNKGPIVWLQSRMFMC